MYWIARTTTKPSLAISRILRTPFPPLHVFTFGVNEKPFQVFDSLCHRIGLLGRLSAQIVSVYLLGKALFTNVRFLGQIQDRLLAKQMTVDRKALLGFTRQVDELYRQFETDGHRVAGSLAKYEHRRWLIMLS